VFDTEMPQKHSADAHGPCLRAPNQWVLALMAVGLLGTFFALCVTSVPQLSLTADEPVYMAAGYAFLRTGDLRMATSAQHPPLLQELVALPLLLQPGPAVETLDGWEPATMARFAPAFTAWYGGTIGHATYLSRIPIIFLALTWAAVVYRWAADWFGPWAGLAALALFTFDPNVLGHAPLATNDVGIATFSFVTMFAATRFVRRPRWRYLVLVSLATGAALSSKSSGFSVAVAVAAVLVVRAAIGPIEAKQKALRALLWGCFMLFVSAAVLWASYGFDVSPLAETGIRVPLGTQIRVWREMQSHLSEGHIAYLNGRISHTGWPEYYAVAYALKTPLWTLILLPVGAAATLRAHRRRWLLWLPTVVFSIGYLAAIIASPVNTGYRFLLPVLPYGYLLIAGLWQSRQQWTFSRSMRRAGVIALVTLGVSLASRVHPHYLAYFNALAGGSLTGHRFLVDSNLDWGQSFIALRSFLEEQGIDKVRLSYYTYANPQLYGIDYEPIAPSPGAPPVLPSRFNPEPGYYAIGATTLQGVMTADSDSYDWFRHAEPIGRPGIAMFVFKVPARGSAASWLAQCTDPVAPLPADAAIQGFGTRNLDSVYFDCTSSWLYPGGGRATGWFALPRDTARRTDPFVQKNLAATSLVYESRSPAELAQFAIYEQQEPPPSPSFPSEEVPQSVGGLVFLGHDGPVPSEVLRGKTVELITWWRVDSAPERPFSIMLHLNGPDGTPIAIADGLGVPYVVLQPGDVFAQRHIVGIPENTAPADYTPATGAYWLDSLERWPVTRMGAVVGDRIALPPLRVTGG
jgi:hypothetical protein